MQVRLVLFMLIASMAVSCDPLVGSARVGLSLTEEGKPEILYAPCQGEAIDRITLAVVRDNLGGSDDQILWEIKAVSQVATQGVIEAVLGGSVPRGFSLSVPLETPLPRTRVLTAAVFPPEGSAHPNSFKLQQLQSGEVLTDADTYVSHAQFLELAEDTCDNRLDN